MAVIAVLGAAGAVGGAVVRRLAEAGDTHVVAVTRRPQTAFPPGVKVRAADLHAPESLAQAFAGADAAVLVPGVALSVQALPALHANGVRRVLAFSSQNLAVPEAQIAYREVAEGEAAIRASGLVWTVLRPTLIYGHPELAAGTSLIRLAQRLPVMISPGLGLAWQQPIFYEDLARVAAWAIRDPEAVGRVIPIGGPEVIRLKALYAAASRAAGGTGLVIPAPMAVVQWAARRLGSRFPLKAEQLSRVRANKHVDAPITLPEEARPQIKLNEGLRRLIESLGAPPKA